MGVNLPDNFVDGQELEASELNKMLSARTNDIKPIDDTTREYTDIAGSLGTSDKRYKEAYIDNIKVDGNTISSIDADGDINITPNGTGEVTIGGNVPNLKCTQINISDTLTLKLAIVTSNQFDINASGTYQYTITHGKGDKLRGSFPPFYTATSGGMSGITSLRLVSISETVLNIEVVAVGNISPATVSCVIFYID